LKWVHSAAGGYYLMGRFMDGFLGDELWDLGLGNRWLLRGVFGNFNFDEDRWLLPRLS
jgi:hypothetical protein